MELTEEQLKQLSDISDEQVKTDLAETIREVEQLNSELQAFRGDMKGNRLEIYFREGKIHQREEFINKLTSILKYRNVPI